MPILSAAVSGGFAYMVTRQYLARRKAYQLVWSVSLWLAALGSLSYAIAVLADSGFFFRLFYLSGAVLMAALLGVGSIYLAFGAGMGRLALLAVAVVGFLVAGAVMGSPINYAALTDLRMTVGSGRGVLSLKGIMVAGRELLNTFGTLAVAGVAIKSARDIKRHGAHPGLFAGNLCIVGGIVANAIAGTTARFMTGFDPFWLLMTGGWILMFAGFLRIEQAATGSRRPFGNRRQRVGRAATKSAPPSEPQL